MVKVVEAEQPDLTLWAGIAAFTGIVDVLQTRGFRVFGPTRAAAKLESSKAFAKRFLQRHNIPRPTSGVHHVGRA